MKFKLQSEISHKSTASRDMPSDRAALNYSKGLSGGGKDAPACQDKPPPQISSQERRQKFTALGLLGGHIRGRPFGGGGGAEADVAGVGRLAGVPTYCRLLLVVVGVAGCPLRGLTLQKISSPMLKHTAEDLCPMMAFSVPATTRRAQSCPISPTAIDKHPSYIPV